MAQDIQTPPADAAKENKTKRKVTYTPVRTVSGSELREMAGDSSGVLENEWNDPGVRTFTEDGFKGVYPVQPPERYHTDEELEEAMPTGNAAGIGAGMVFSGGAIPPSVARELYKNETSRAGNTSGRYARMKEERAWRDNEAKYAVDSAIADGFKPDGTSMRNIQEKYVASYYYTAKGRDRYNRIKEETNRLKEYLTPYIEQETAGNPLYQKAVADYRAGKISMEQLAETQEMLRRESPSYKKAAEWSMQQNRQYAREASDYFSPYIEKEMVPFLEQGLDKSISDFRSLQGERPDEFTGVADNLLNKAEKLRDAARNGGFLMGMGDTASDWNFWSLGIADLYRAKNIREIADKADKALREGADVEFTPEELNTLQAYAIYQQALNLYSEKVPLSYTMGQVTAEMIPFATSIALGQGLVKLTTKGISAVAKKAATREVAQAVSQALGKSKLLNSRFAQGFRQGAGFGGETTGAAGVAGNMLGGMTRGTGEALTVGAPRTWAEKNERMTGQADIDVTDSGQPLITGFSGRESGGEAFAHALAGNAIEYQSERAGQLIDRLGGALKARLPKDLQLSMGYPGDYIKSITPKSLKRFYKSPYYKAFKDNIQLQGVWSEYGEEELANWERVLLGLDEPDVLLDNEQRVETFLSLLPAQLMMGAGAGVYSAGRYRQASARLDKLMKEMKASDPELYEKYDKVRGEMDGFDVKAVTGLLSSIDRDGKLDAGQKTEVKRAALTEYYTKMLKSAQEAEIFGRADEEMRQAYEQAEALKERGSGNIVTADYEGRKVNITDDTGSDTVVIEYVDEDGKRVKRQVPRSAVGNAATVPVADVVNSKADEITARVKTEMQELEHPGVAAPEPGMRLVHNGENYAVTSISPDGVVIMREDEEGNNSLPEVISLDTYYAEKQAEIDAQEQQPQSGESGEAVQEIASPAEEEPAPVTGGGAVQEETAPGRMPKDEQGQPLYEQADAETAWDALLEQAGGDEAMAQEVANDIVSEQEKALKAAERELKKVQDGKPQQRKGDAPLTVEARIAAKQAVREQTSRAQAGVDEARKRLEAWRKIAETPQRRRQAIEAERRQEEEEAARLRGIQEEQERAEREEAERIRREALNGVPDFIEDRPQDARARGYRRVNGNRVDRQQPIQARRGGEVQVKFDDNNIPTGHAALIEASQLQPSHTDGRRNPQHFIDEAQPKERNDEASVMSSRKIAANIRPEEITSSVTAYTGAPTVNSRGEVIQGNNRSAALREMWAEHPEQAAKYRQYLADHAADFGLTPEDVEAMQQPVLVNMLDVTDDEAITLGQFVAQDTESGGTERIKPKNMVRKMGDDMRSFANRLLASADEEMSFAELVDRNGADVLKWMQQKGYITPTQYKSAFDSKGNLTAEAKNDLKGVMYQSIFQNGSTHLEEMFNALPAKAQKAILATAYRDYDSPNTERMIEEIQDSISAYHALSQDPAFAGARNYKEARIAAEAWKRQYAFDYATGESYLPSERYSNFALLLATMYKGQTQTFIQKTLGHIYDLVQGTQEADLFNQPDNTPRTLVQAINETLGNLREELLLNENFTYNGQRRSNVLAGGSEAGQRGRQGSDGNASSGGRAENGSRQADNSRRTETDSGLSRRDGTQEAGDIRQPAPMDEKARRASIRLNGEQCDILLAQMREQAEVAPDVELNPTTWNERFGENGIIITPLGEVKMGENQIAKFFAKGREKEFGMVAPTLSDPDIIIEKKAPASNAERDTKLLFIKTFIKADGSRYVNFESVTVQKDGMEVSISSHEVDAKVVKKEMQNGNILHLRIELPFSSEWYLTETPTQERPDLVPTSDKKKNVEQNAELPASATTTQDKPFVQTGVNDGSKPADTHSDNQRSGNKDKKTSAETSQERQKTDSNLSEAFKQQMNIRIGQLSKFIQTKDGKLKKKYESLRKTPFFAIFDSGNIYEGPVAIAKTPREALNVAFNYDIGDFEVLYVDFRTKSLDMDLLSIYDVSGFRGDVYDENGAYKDEAKNLLVERISRLGKGNSTEVQGVEDFQQRESGADALRGNADENIRRAESEVERNPSEAQKEAGNYRKGHVRVDGLDVTIENPKGSVRSGTDADGKRWETVMNNTYGYMRGTEGVDGDHIDVFLSDNPESGNVYVIDQRDPKTGEFDEHKVMYGFGSMEEARNAYLKNYTPGWQGLGAITEVSKDEFKKWIGSSKRKTKPFAEYKSVKKEAGQNEDVRQSRDGSSPLSAEEAAIRDAIVERLRESGIEVITDAEAGQRVLDEANGRGEPVRTQAMLDGLKKASDFILSALGGKTKQRKARIEIPERANRLAEEAIGHPIKSHAININELVHIKKRHGENGTANDANSIPLRDEDIALMPYIMAAPTRVIKGSMAVNGTESVRYEKDLDNGVVVVVEREGRFDVEDMENITMWAKKKPATNVTVAEKASHSTSETIVISETDSAKIRKDAEDAIHGDEKVREHRVYHGSGADFEAFDHSHMGEGEGAQAYGWGSYVTEVEGIGRTYAKASTENKRENATVYKRRQIRDNEISINVIRGMIAEYPEQHREREKRLSDLEKELADQNSQKGRIEKESGKDSVAYRNFMFYAEDIIKDLERNIERTKRSIEDEAGYNEQRKRQVEELVAENARLQSEIDAIEAQYPRHLYTVEIPDDTGENYLEWEKDYGWNDIDRFARRSGGEVDSGDLGVGLEDDGNAAASGASIVKSLEETFGEKEASEILSKCGFTGISYPAQATTGGRKDGARNYVIFDEKDLQITDHVRFFRTPGGEAYGFTAGGKIYIDPRVATADTPIHEYAHLWAGALRQANPKEWNNIVELMRDTPAWDEVKRLYPELESDEEIADEALAMYSGRRGAERLREAARRAWNESADLGVKAAAARAMGRVRDALRRFWQNVADLLHFRHMSAEEVADRVMRDLMEGVNPNRIKSATDNTGAFSAGNDDIRYSRAEEEDANRRFNEELDKWESGGMSANEYVTVGNPIGVLKHFTPDLPIILRQKVLSKSRKKHGLSASDMRNLPAALAEPIFIFKSSDNTIGVLTGLVSDSGENIFVAIELDANKQMGHQMLEVNDILTIHGRETENIINPIKENNTLKWVDKEKGLNWLSSAKSNSQAVTNKALDTATNIVKDFENPSLEDENLFRIGETKRIGGESLFGRRITFTRANPTVTLNAMKRWVLKNADLKEYDVSRTGSRYLSFTHNGVDYKIRSANHTKAYDGVRPDSSGLSVSVEDRIYGVEIDLAENEMVKEDILRIIEDTDRLNDTGLNLQNTVESGVLPDEMVSVDRELTDAVIREVREMAEWRLDSARTKAESEYEREHPLEDYKADNGIMILNRYFYGRVSYEVKFPDGWRGKTKQPRADAIQEYEDSDAHRRNMEQASGMNVYVDGMTKAQAETLRKIDGLANRLEQERMAGAVREMAERLHLEGVEVVTDASTLTGRRARAKGFYSPRTGKISIVIPNHASEADAVQTLLHEAVAHKGLRQLFGEHFDTFLWNVYRNADRDVRERINALASEKGWDFPTATEEYLASLAENTDFENAQRSGWWEKIKRLFIDMLHKMGLDRFSGVTLSDNELRYILWRSYENLREPGAERSITGVAADVVKQAELKVGNYAEEATGGNMAAERGKKEASETDSVLEREHQHTVISDATGTKILNNLDNLVKRYENSAQSEIKTFIGEVSKAIGARRHGSKSEYATFETKNGKIITIRLSDHNASTRNFDNAGRNNGISIVITARKNNGVANDGNAHVVEFYYDAIKLRKTAGKPLAQIVRSIQQSLYSGEYHDTTGLAVRDEVNNDEDSLLFRDGSAAEDGTRDTPLSSPTIHAWDRLAQSLKFQLRETAVDYLTAIDKFQDLIAKHSGRKIESFENAYDWMTFLSSRNRVEMDMFDSSVVRPLNNAILKLTREKRRRGKWKWDEGALRELVMYVEAKHGTDRNRQMAVEEYVENFKMESLEFFEKSGIGFDKELYRKELGEIKREAGEKAYAESYEKALEKLRADSVPEEEAKEKASKTAKRSKEKAALKASEKFRERRREELAEQYREKVMAAWTAEKKRINSQNISWIEKQRQLDAAAARIGADIEQDYSGLSSIFGDTEQYPGGWREESLIYAADYEAVHENADIASLWNAIDAATGFALRKQYETGLVSREYVDRQRERFEHYIPLRGFSDETAGDVYSYIGHDFYPGGNPVKTAHGRMSEAGNPFGSILNIAYSSISAGNKNMAKTALYALVRNHDTDGLAVVNRAWMVRYDKLKEMPELSDVVTMPTFEAGEETPKWVEAVPRIPEAATSDDITRIMSKFEDVMTEYRKEDFTKPIRKNNKTAYRTLNKERSEHDIPLFIAGEKYVITVTGNPRPAQAMNGLLNPDVNEDALSELGKRVQRFMAGAFTGKNAAFSIANLFRDTIYANNQMFIRENPAYWLKFTRNQRLGFGDFIPMMRRLKKFREGTLGNSKDDRLFKEFMQNGGATGYTFVNTQEEYARELAGKLDELSRKTPEWFSPKGLIKLFFDAVQFAGESAELVNRFAAYKTSREMGRTMGRSIRDAKEITVNFNRKGAGRKSADKNKSWYSPVNMASAVSQYGRCSILFWNANMQGKYRFYKNMTEYPVKTSVTLMANNMALAAVVLPLLNNVALPMLYELMGLGDDGDDENYFNVLTDWERTHNICVRLPKSNWLKIPISPDFVSWFSMGDAIGGQVSGEREMSAKDFITAVIDAVSPLSMNWSYEGSQMLLNFAPTVTQPLLQNAMNVNFMGNPLKKTPYNSKQGFKPEYQMVYSSASPTLVELSRLSNRILGGTDLKTSGWADWNPAELQNLISGYTGGYGTTFLSAADWIVGTAKGEKQAVTFSRMPLVSRFAISGNKDVKLSRVNSRFYDVKNFVDEFEYDLKSYEDAIELAQKEKDAFKTAEYVAKREELIKSERAGRYQLLKGYVKAAKDCEDYLEELPEDEVTRNFLYNLKQEAINLLYGEYKKKE